MILLLNRLRLLLPQLFVTYFQDQNKLIVALTAGAMVRIRKLSIGFFHQFSANRQALNTLPFAIKPQNQLSRHNCSGSTIY